MAPPKGFHHSEASRKKMSASRIGKRLSEETKRKLSEIKKGIPKEYFKGSGNPNYGKCHTEEAKKKISECNSGERNHNYGKHFSEEHRKKIGESRIGKQRSDDLKLKIIEYKIGGLWYGNVRYNDSPQYCEKWNNDLRERVRAFWNYQCFECGTPQNGKRLSVHHIHYNKKTCCDGSPHDMIPLCDTCHMKTNANRDYWEDHFTGLLYAYSPDGKCFFTKDEMKQYTQPL